MSYKSPFSNIFPNIPQVDGVELYTAHSGMRYKKDDVLLAKFSSGANVAGIFTKNSMPGEPVIWCKKILSKGFAKALVVNSGYSNVFVGERGKQTISITAKTVSQICNCVEEEVYISSTGIIGEPVKDEFLVEALKNKLKPANYEQATIAINTTDTFCKGVYKEAVISGKRVKIAGIIKGSGMIAPNMATMLGYIFTDANISSQVLQHLLDEVKDKTYNAITVDSDTSTSDTILAFATGKAGNAEIKDIEEKDFRDFRNKFFEINLELAKLVIKDGEGITKFVTIEVTGAKDDSSAKTIALSIANSPLVKTAIAGQDPNWGRIVGAIGKSGEPADKDKTSVWLGGIQVAKDGALNLGYKEQQGKDYMKNPDITIKAYVGVGQGGSTVYTCDLTHEYININADYRS